MRYCESMTRTEPCELMPKQMARLLRLAAREADAAHMDTVCVSILAGCHDEVRQLIKETRFGAQLEMTL